ncbi:hypothetical protein [Prevotella melaninogenica]|uniref:hypothetical protein n=1 Tax=Prevotella melaninogenica TaxID=28132 RepID=UPI001C60F7C6|nr:hypothetical protein [Prevotella melaninogenica]MBW4896974.1 hypothetical protein [Prevotella melaninogenica]
MRKSIQKWTYVLVASVFALVMCFSLSACGSDDENDVNNGVSPVLYSDFEGEIGVNYPLGISGKFVGFSIPKSQAGKIVDLTKGGDWVAYEIWTRLVGSEMCIRDRKGSYVYLLRTGANEIELRYKYIWKEGTATRTIEGNYKNVKMTTHQDAIDWAHRQGLY